MLWEVETGQARFFARPGTNLIRLLVFSLDGRYLAAADEFKTREEMAGSNDDERRTVRVWNVGAHSRIPNGAVLLILFSVVVFLVGLVSEQISALRFEGGARRHG